MTLDQFLALARGQTGLALASNILRLLRAPNVYAVSELLDLPNVQALADDPAHAPSLTLLRLFVSGTYSDYKASRASYPELDEPLLTKLKVLSLVSIASERKALPYAELAAELDCPTVPDLEALVIAAVYSGLLRARMDQRGSSVEISHCAGRDICDAASLAALESKLSSWVAAIDATAASVAATALGIEQQLAVRQSARAAHVKMVEDSRKDMPESTEGYSRSGQPSAPAVRSGGGADLSQGSAASHDRAHRSKASGVASLNASAATSAGASLAYPERAAHGTGGEGTAAVSSSDAAAGDDSSRVGMEFDDDEFDDDEEDDFGPETQRGEGRRRRSKRRQPGLPRESDAAGALRGVAPPTQQREPESGGAA